jgi:phosphoglycerate dehydrogenase-like enzyme
MATTAQGPCGSRVRRPRLGAHDPVVTARRSARVRWVIARIAIESSADLIPRSDHQVTERRRVLLAKSVEDGGGQIVPANEANGLIWTSVGDVAPLVALLDENPHLSWVQLPWAGVENVARSGLLSRAVTFTCAKGLFAEQVAEHALLLILTCLRHVVVRARTRSWLEIEPNSLFRRRVTILGAGGTARALLGLLRPFDCRVRVLRRRREPVAEATDTLPMDQLHQVLPTTEVLILALALTDHTNSVLGAQELALLSPHAVVVNVARGALVDTAALTAALRDRRIGAAALDVTEPEPLPSEHPLWRLDNVLITSHCADSTEFVITRLCERVRENVRRFTTGQPLAGVVDSAAGY